MTATTAPTATATATSGAGRPSGLRRALPLVAVALAVVALGLLTGNRSREGEPLDPRSSTPLGARGLVLLLERFGAEVRLTGELPARGTAVLLVDRLGRADRRRLGRWVAGGGTLVVADPFSGFAPAFDRDAGGPFAFEEEAGPVLTPQCDLPALAPVSRIEVPGAAPLRVGEGQVGCFPVGPAAGREPGPRPSYLVARSQGAGVVVALGGGAAFVNRQLDEADNATLAVSLMAPRRGAVVAILEPSDPGSGREGLGELVSRPVKDGIWQLLIAFAVFAAWKGRRLGRPRVEPQPVQISGSELVVAVGNLLQHARRREQAAAMLRAQLRRTLSERLGVPVDAPVPVLARAAASRAGVPAHAVAEALQPADPAGDKDLVLLARTLESIRKEVTRVR